MMQLSFATIVNLCLFPWTCCYHPGCRPTSRRTNCSELERYSLSPQPSALLPQTLLLTSSFELSFINCFWDQCVLECLILPTGNCFLDAPWFRENSFSVGLTTT